MSTADAFAGADGFQFLYADKLSASACAIACASWPGGPSEGYACWAFLKGITPRAIPPRARTGTSQQNGGVEPLSARNIARQHLPVLRRRARLAAGACAPMSGCKTLKLSPIGRRLWAAMARARRCHGARHATNAGFSDAEAWLPVDPEHVALAVDAQNAIRFRRCTLRGAHSAYAASIRIEKQATCASHDAADPLLVFERGDGREALLCVFNLSDGPQTWRPARWLAPSLSGLICRTTPTMCSRP